MKIGNKRIGLDGETFIIAEISGNHNGSLKRAKHLIKSAKDAGVDAIKFQTYTADTITLNCYNDYFNVQTGTIWDGRNLYDLYKEAHTPWEWHKELFDYCRELDIICFSSPFDLSAVDFLEKLNVPAYKIASFEINDERLIRYVATKGKPIILSTGVATLAEIERAVTICKEEGNDQLILLKCCSSYPAPYSEMNLRTIPNMQQTFNTIVGLSDHSLGYSVALGAVALGATVIEKHITLDRNDGGVDSKFSMEPNEFKEMVREIRNLEKALGSVCYDFSERQKGSATYKRSLFVCKDILEGEVFTSEHIKSVRPFHGLNTKYYEDILGKRATRDIKMGTPLDWEMIKN